LHCICRQSPFSISLCDISFPIQTSQNYVTSVYEVNQMMPMAISVLSQC
jgi:hypothetical protein